MGTEPKSASGLWNHAPDVTSHLFKTNDRSARVWECQRHISYTEFELVRRTAPTVKTSQSRTVSSAPPLANVPPSGEKASARTVDAWPLSSLSNSPVCVSQRPSTPPSRAAARILLSGENAIETISIESDVRILPCAWPVEPSNSSIEIWPGEAANVLPSGEKLKASILAAEVSMEGRTFRPAATSHSLMIGWAGPSVPALHPEAGFVRLEKRRAQAFRLQF